MYVYGGPQGHGSKDLNIEMLFLHIKLKLFKIAGEFYLFKLMKQN